MKGRKHYGIVGTGPSALVAVLDLLNRGHIVTIIEPSNLRNGKRPYQRRLILKDRKEKNHVYGDGPPIYHESITGIFPLETRSFGGLSNIWGGVFFPSFRSYYWKQGLGEHHYSKVEKSLESFLKIEKSSISEWDLEGWQLSREKTQLRFYSPQLALNNLGEIWSANEAWSHLLSQKQANLISGVVLKFREHIDLVEVTIKANHETFTEVFDVLLIGAGPIGNAKIVLNSLPNINEIRLEDSSVSYSLGLKLTRSTVSEKMRPLRCGFETLNGHPTAYFQIYDLSEQLLKSLRFRTLQVIAKAFNILVGNSVRIVMSFANGDCSNGLSIKRVEECIRIEKVEKEGKSSQKFMIRRLFYFLLKEKILLLPLSIKAKVGDGAHLAGGPYVLGKRVRAIGMSGTSRVYAGPVTFLAMALTLKIIEEVEENREL